MAQSAPGNSHRKGLTLLQIADMFRDEEVAMDWIAELRWPHGPHCPTCGTFHVSSGIKHRTMTHRCLDCPGKPFFSLRKGTVMEASKLPYRVWAIGIYLFTTNLKGISSMRLHRELGITHKAAWFMLHRLCLAAETGAGVFTGPVEADETYVGGKRKNMSKAKRRELADTGRGPVGKVAVVGLKDGETKQVRARLVASTDKPTFRGFVAEHADPDATVYTDEASAYEGLPFRHETVKHGVLECVRGQAHINGVESLWSMLKRGYIGVYHKMSPKHLARYVAEFEKRHNVRDDDIAEQMGEVVQGMGRKRLRYKDLIAPNGLDSGARGR